jgi:hypothetical protein
LQFEDPGGMDDDEKKGIIDRYAVLNHRAGRARRYGGFYGKIAGGSNDGAPEDLAASLSSGALLAACQLRPDALPVDSAQQQSPLTR